MGMTMIRIIIKVKMPMMDSKAILPKNLNQLMFN